MITRLVGGSPKEQPIFLASKASRPGSPPSWPVWAVQVEGMVEGVIMGVCAEGEEIKELKQNVLQELPFKALAKIDSDEQQLQVPRFSGDLKKSRCKGILLEG
jgi:hypothetical protein